MSGRHEHDIEISTVNMPRYRDDDRYYDEDRSYYDDNDDDGGYSYGESYGDSYTSYRSHNRGGGGRVGGGRNNNGGGARRDNDYNNNRNNSMRHRGSTAPSNNGVAMSGTTGGGVGSSARIYPQDNNNRAGGGGGGVAFADDEENIYMNGETQMTRLNNTTTNNNAKTKLVDFDSYETDAEKLSAILKVADVELQKHALTSEYYTLRKYSILVPIIILSLFVAMAGFIAASNIITATSTPRVGDSTMQEFLTLLVASCGFLVLLLTLLGNQLDYNSKIKFHNGAQDDLMALCEKMRMYRVERAMDERVVEEEMAEVRRKEMEMGELDLGDTESEESEMEDYDVMEEDERILLDEEQGGGGGGMGGAAAWDTVVKLNTGEVPTALQQNSNHNGGGAIVVRAPTNNNNNNPTTKKQAAMERKIARQAKKQIKLSKKLDKKNEYLTKELVNQKITQERQQQEMSKDIITFYGYHAELHQIISGCKSDVPPEISKFFQVMENRVELMSLSRLGIQEESRMRKNQIIRLCATEIYNEIQGFALWPMTVPPVDSTIEESLRTVGQLLNMNYRAQRRCKLIPCCPIPLCCKKKTSNNIFSVINEGIDQRELDMMQAERVEVLRQVNERKARLMAGPAEVLELKDEESVKVVPTMTTATMMNRKPKDPAPTPWMIEQNTVQQQMKDYVDFGDGYSRATVDPDGSVMNEMMTEASDPKAVKNGVNGLGLYVHEEEGIDEDGTGGGTFEGIAPAPKSEAYSTAISQQMSRDANEQEKAEKKAKKKKKKKKQKKKNKKKSKKKAKEKKEESAAVSMYSEEEYDDDDYASYDDDVDDERSYSPSEGSGSY